MTAALFVLWLVACPNGIVQLGPSAGGGGPGGSRPAALTALWVSPDGSQAVTGAQNGGLRRWSLGEQLLPEDFGRLPGAVIELHGRAHEGSWELVAGDDAGHLRRISAKGEQTPLGEHPGGILALALAPDGARAASAGADGIIRVWPLTPESKPLELRGHAGPVAGVAFDPRDSDRLWSVGWDATLRWWKLGRRTVTKKSKGRLEAGPRELSGLVISPDGERLLSACFDGSLTLWSVGKKKPKPAPLPDRSNREWVSQLRFAPDGATAVAIAPAESKLLVVDVAAGRTRSILRTQVPAVATFLPEAGMVLLANYDGTLSRVRLDGTEAGQ